MKRVLDFACPLLASLSLLLFCPSLDAQLPKGLEQCLPYPTLAQELQSMRDETQKPATDQAENTPVRIVAITFVGGNNMSPLLRNSLTRLILRHRHYDDPGLDWLREIQEVDVRGFLQDSGYFQTEATLEAQRVTKESRTHDYSLILNVESGPQYRLGTVRFASTDPDKDLSSLKTNCAICLRSIRATFSGRIGSGAQWNRSSDSTFRTDSSIAFQCQSRRSTKTQRR